MSGFAIAGGLLFAWLLRHGSFQPYFETDSHDYIELSGRMFFTRAALRSIRTLGYPLFLKMIGLVSSAPEAVPIAQFLVFLLALAIFFTGLTRFGATRRFASAVTAYLAVVICAQTTFSTDNFRPGMFYFSRVLTESLNVSAGIALFGVLLWLAAARTARAAWTLGGVAAALLFACYQVRPANLFLIGLGPVVLAALVRLRRGVAFFRLAARKAGPALAALAIGPLIGFCLFRGIAVGHFGLVSFGGHNFVGITGQLLSADMVPGLPEDIRPLAEAILERREKWGFVSPVLGRYNLSCKRLEGFFDTMQWRIADPAAAGLFGNDMVAMNRALSRLSFAVIRRLPGVYAAWIAKTLGASFTMAMSTPAFLLPAIGLLLLGALAAVAPLVPGLELPGIEAALEREPEAVSALWLIAVGFFAVQMFMIVLVQEPLPRYVFSSEVFLPLIPFAGLFNWVSCLRRDRVARGTRAVERADRGGDLVDLRLGKRRAHRE